MENQSVRCRGRRQVTIDMLPDDILLDIFDFCMGRHINAFVSNTNMWPKLAHVCRRWRDVVFQSPSRLDLQILCTPRTPVRDSELLGIWPAFPLIIWVGYGPCKNNIFAAFEHRDRICRIDIDNIFCPKLLETFLPLMQAPFPALTHLELTSHDLAGIPDSFLGGSAPHLRHLYLESIPFPTLPKLLLSATDLVTLILRDVPHSGYISPEAMATCLFVLIKLERLELGFQSPTSRADQESRHLHLQGSAILPSLTCLEFEGASEYLEGLVARIDATPLLAFLDVCFFVQPIFHTTHLSQFISRVPKFQELNEARMAISNSNISVRVPSPTRAIGHTVFTMGIPRRDSFSRSSWQPSSLVQLYNSFLLLFPTMERLYMISLRWQDIKNTEWLEILHPFATVKNLYLSKESALRTAPALQELVGERVAEVLPALQNIFLADLQPSGPVQQAVEQFAYARLLSGHPIAISQWDVESNMRWEI